MRGEAAPYALVRLAAQPHPAGAVSAAPFRRAVEALAAVEAALLSLAGPGSKLLHDSADTHPGAYHRSVVLPLRRDVHNGRMPRASLCAEAETLASRIPRLGEWLSAVSQRAVLTAEIDRLLPDALAAEREVLTSVCGNESLRRAAVFAGRDVRQGLARAGAGDGRARKAEPAVLRHALRATSKAGPPSWCAAVGWATWSPDAPTPDWGTPVAVTRVNHVLLTRLVAALLADRAHLFDHPHRLAPGVHTDDTVRFRRDVPALGPLRATAGMEEDVELASSPPLRFLIGLTAANPKGISPAELASALATRLPDDESGRAQHHVALLLDVKLLVPVLPIDPQDPAALPALASWLRDTGRCELAGHVASVHRDTVAFAGLDAAARPAALAALFSSWEALGALAGTDLGGVTPVSEDVVLPLPVRLGRAHGRDGVRSLAALTPLLMLLDRRLAIRRHSRDRFVVEFGRGGSARLTACAPLLREAMSGAPTGGLGASRAQVADLVRDGVITDEAVTAAEDLLPAWMRTRPVSYSFFAQPSPDGLVVNRVHDGFGRFPGRYLDLLPPEAYATVRATWTVCSRAVSPSTGRYGASTRTCTRCSAAPRSVRTRAGPTTRRTPWSSSTTRSTTSSGCAAATRVPCSTSSTSATSRRSRCPAAPPPCTPTARAAPRTSRRCNRPRTSPACAWRAACATGTSCSAVATGTSLPGRCGKRSRRSPAPPPSAPAGACPPSCSRAASPAPARSSRRTGTDPERSTRTSPTPCTCACCPACCPATPVTSASPRRCRCRPARCSRSSRRPTGGPDDRRLGATRRRAQPPRMTSAPARCTAAPRWAPIAPDNPPGTPEGLFAYEKL